MHRPLTLPPGRAALLLIDLQEEHRRDPRYLVDGYGQVLANAKRLLDAARTAKSPVIHAAYQRDFTKVPRRAFEPVGDGGTPLFSDPDSPMTAICLEVGPRPDEPLLTKNDASCFTEPEFRGMLWDIAPEWLIIAGVWTEACVGHTVWDAVGQGYRVLLVKDACGSGSAAMHQSALIHLANRLHGGGVVSTDDAVALIEGKTREVWQLVGSTPLRFRAETIGQVYDSI